MVYHRPTCAIMFHPDSAAHGPCDCQSKELDEPILPDDYPVYCGYAYVADGMVILSDIQGTVRNLKRDAKAKEIRRCDMNGRGLFKEQRPCQ
jgi:hypothetical protein